MHYGFASQKGKPKTVGLARFGRRTCDPSGEARFLTSCKIPYEIKRDKTQDPLLDALSAQPRQLGLPCGRHENNQLMKLYS
jgi:hypothetical protein